MPRMNDPEIHSRRNNTLMMLNGIGGKPFDTTGIHSPISNLKRVTKKLLTLTA
jgi:hypothetical protein